MPQVTVTPFFFAPVPHDASHSLQCVQLCCTRSAPGGQLGSRGRADAGRARAQALMGSAQFCELLGQLRGAAPALAPGQPTLHALAQLAAELQPAERRNGAAPRADEPADAEVRTPLLLSWFLSLAFSHALTRVAYPALATVVRGGVCPSAPIKMCIRSEHTTM